MIYQESFHSLPAEFVNNIDQSGAAFTNACRFFKMTDHYNTGAGAGGLLIWIMAWR